MTLKKIQHDIAQAGKKIVGKYCFACGKSKPIDQFDIIPKKSITKCRDCKAKYEKRG